jgi:hypothetical protein
MEFGSWVTYIECKSYSCLYWNAMQLCLQFIHRLPHSIFFLGQIFLSSLDEPPYYILTFKLRTDHVTNFHGWLKCHLRSVSNNEKGNMWTCYVIVILVPSLVLKWCLVTNLQKLYLTVKVIYFCRRHNTGAMTTYSLIFNLMTVHNSTLEYQVLREDTI